MAAIAVKSAREKSVHLLKHARIRCNVTQQKYLVAAPVSEFCRNIKKKKNAILFRRRFPVSTILSRSRRIGLRARGVFVIFLRVRLNLRYTCEKRQTSSVERVGKVNMLSFRGVLHTVYFERMRLQTNDRHNVKI